MATVPLAAAASPGISLNGGADDRLAGEAQLTRRAGRVREVHGGWSGPATGPLNAKARRDFDAAVTGRLRDKA
jgi:hypothetical protein